ncbi:MAG: 30S ribosomal protein S7 [Ignavibacteriales bacterium CG07_land_8_20_14_0_80_59_12]|jgi:small subunit ribosomal protein S7|nr:MAG: 30S ribosomal protein S7 [Ignavibacteriales bacterium CG07_land_8_20_14_0_80_59_12]
MRKKRAPKRQTTPDPKFNNPLVERFINNVMKQGKKQTARNIVYTSFDIMEKKTKTNGAEVFQKAVGNVQPLLEVRARRVGGATYQVPTEVRSERRTALAIRWIIQYAQERSGRSMSEKLAEELIAASKNEGGAVKKKDDVHRMAEANKAFAHFRW